MNRLKWNLKKEFAENIIIFFENNLMNNKRKVLVDILNLIEIYLLGLR